MDAGPDAIGRHVIRFGVFELDPHTGELRKRGVRVKLQGKPLQILKALLEQPGQIVTREELQRRLWSSDVFVDFDSGLNTAANRLRLALGDSADTPRYIETLPRVGYRFIAPIDPAAARERAGPRPGISRRTTVAASLAAAMVVAVAAAVGLRLVSAPEASAAFQFRQITFGRGQISGARFAPDGETIFYTANWNDGTHLYVTHPSRPESRRLDVHGRRLVAVSRSGQLAFLSSDGTMPLAGGTLSKAPLNGGAPLDIERNVMSADWSANGETLAIVRAIDGTNQLEYPPGTVIAKTSGWMSGVRVSHDGRRIAFIEHPVRHDNQGSLKVFEGRAVRTLSGPWANAGGVAWHPEGKQVWFTASRDETPKSLWAVDLDGRIRRAGEMPGAISLRDIAPDGRVLATRESRRLEMAVMTESEPAARDISLHDWSRVADVSPDGRMILFDESGAAAGAQYQIYIRRVGDDAAAHLGEGRAMAFSPDLDAILALGTKPRSRLRVVPIGEGRTIEIGTQELEYQWARYFPDRTRILALANAPNQPLRLFVIPLTGSAYPITPPVVVRNSAISPDGSRVAILSAEGKLLIYPATPGGSVEAVRNGKGLAPILWKENDLIYVQHIGASAQIPTRISRLDLKTGRAEPWRDIAPSDPVGVNAITKVMLSQDARTLVFNYRRVFSELFLAHPGLNRSR
jgi:DNA-binding winged helix-turn-helix (wHTH) protein/Tol biopolymer transport system component